MWAPVGAHRANEGAADPAGGVLTRPNEAGPGLSPGARRVATAV
jgi:hypothetical protein